MEPKTELPAIPPNCEHFVEDDTFGLAFVYYREGHKRGRTKYVLTLEGDEDHLDMRLIIASVAEVAWLKEAERLRDEANEIENAVIAHGDQEEMEAKSDPTWALYVEAREHAKAWRRWGTQHA